MSGCCATTPDTDCSATAADQDTTSPICESCSQKGKSVQRLAPESLLKPESVARLQETAYRICATPTCQVVYFSNETEQYFHKIDMRVRVGFKETDHPVPICYCFDHTLRDVEEEICATGTTTIPDRIRAMMKTDACQCESKNPQGSCCLGNVRRAVKNAMAEAELQFPV
jgi:hypothetical protein